MTATRFSIRFDGWYRVLSSALLLSPSKSYLEIGPREVIVRMGWAFRATFPRSSVIAVRPSTSRPLSRGVHGFGGRWLVNGSADGMVSLDLVPEQRAWVLGVPVALRELMISVDDPAVLAAALGSAAG